MVIIVLLSDISAPYLFVHVRVRVHVHLFKVLQLHLPLSEVSCFVVIEPEMQVEINDTKLTRKSMSLKHHAIILKIIHFFVKNLRMLLKNQLSTFYLNYS